MTLCGTLWKWIKAFYKSMCDSFNKALHVGKVNPYSECLLQQEQNATLSIMDTCDVINWLLDSWLITLRNGAIWETRCWSLLVADWALNQLWWVKVYVVEPMYSIHPCHYCHFVHKPIGQWQSGWRERMTGICKWVILPLDH